MMFVTNNRPDNEFVPPVYPELPECPGRVPEHRERERSEQTKMKRIQIVTR